MFSCRILRVRLWLGFILRGGVLLGDECVLGLDCVAGVFLGYVVVVVLAVVETFIF